MFIDMASIGRRELDHTHRMLAWRILHDSVYCGAIMPCAHCSWCRLPLPLLCRSQYSHSHPCVTCPLASAVWAWLREVWASISGATCPPATLSDLLADDVRIFHPPPWLMLNPLWTRLRLAVCMLTGVQLCQARHGQSPAGAHSIAACVLSYCQGLMLQHWVWIGLH